MPKPYPKEFRDEVVRVGRKREADVTLEQIADDFGIHAMMLSKWLRQAAAFLFQANLSPICGTGRR